MQTQRIHSFLEHLSGSVAVVSVQLLDKPSTNPPLHFITARYLCDKCSETGESPHFKISVRMNNESPCSRH